MIKKLIKSIVPKKFIQPAKDVISFAYRTINFKPKIGTNYELFAIGKPDTDTYFGYYDITPFNAKDEILYLEIPNGSAMANIVLGNISANEHKIITYTNAWNWQQGARLRWFPDSEDKIVFNDFINDKYVCRILNVRTNESRTIDTPVYDVSPDGKYGITLNFERLGVLRPGYGYTNKPYCDQYDLSEESIRLVDMNTGKEDILLTYEAIAHIMGQSVDSYKHFYINHLSFSPDGQKVMFLWIEIIGTFHKASLLVYDFNNKTTIVLEKELKSSHYAWRDNSSILCAACNNPATAPRCRFYVYNANTENINMAKQIICPDILQWDGHPVYLTKDIIVIDTYPNKYAYQKLFLINLVTKQKTKLIEIYSTPQKKEEERTDLHPRLNKSKNMICFDANVYGQRKLYFLKGWR